MSRRKIAATALLAALVGLSGCEFASPEGADVSDEGNVEAVVHTATSTVCFYQNTGYSGSVDCVRTDSVPDSYPTFADLDQFRVHRNEATETVCYEWKNGALSCLPTPEDDATATEQSPTDGQ